MLAKCANPVCCAPFRYLEEGELFRLEADPAESRPNSRRPEYFWLCDACSKTMTLRLDESASVRMTALQGSASAGEEPVDFILLDRKKGLVLNRISLPTHRVRWRPQSLPGGQNHL